ncbi:MAG: potassium channel family protein [Nitrospiria bacterium]
MFDHKILRLFLLTIFILIFGALGLTYFEGTASPLDALWWSFVTITTVGYGDVTPTTVGGRVTGVIVMVFGIGLLGMFTATVASIFVEGKLKEGKGLKTITDTGHFIVCGWNYKAAEILEELRADRKIADRPIVLLADLPEKPVADDNLRFVAGAVTNDGLQKANLPEAAGVLILSDESLDAQSRDAKVVFNTLTIRALHSKIYICAEITDAKNAQHCKMAGANEIVVIGALSSHLLVQAALDHGITHMITELVSNRAGSSLYKITPPANLIGRPFVEALPEMKRQHNAIPIAIESKDENRFISNPPMTYEVRPDDLFVIISEQRPET